MNRRQMLKSTAVAVAASPALAKVAISQGGKVKWYGMFTCHSRQDSWKKRVAHDFGQDERPEVVAAVLLQAAYFNKEEAVRDYDAFTGGDKEALFFLGECEWCRENCKGQETKRGGLVFFGDEWEGGIGKDKESAVEAHGLADQDEDDDFEW